MRKTPKEARQQCFVVKGEIEAALPPSAVGKVAVEVFRERGYLTVVRVRRIVEKGVSEEGLSLTAL